MEKIVIPLNFLARVTTQDGTTCEAEVEAKYSHFSGDPEEITLGEIRCSGCGHRIAVDELAPRVAIALESQAFRVAENEARMVSAGRCA